MIIAVDFDGTCVTHEFPNIGRDIGAGPVLKYLTEKGHQLILNTMRSDVEDPKSNDSLIVSQSGNFLSDALGWFDDRRIPLWGIQTNPEQHNWTTSPKVYAQVYIDDAALGCPLVTAKRYNIRPFVDWEEVCWLLHANFGIIDLKDLHKLGGKIDDEKQALFKYLLTKTKHK